MAVKVDVRVLRFKEERGRAIDKTNGPIPRCPCVGAPCEHCTGKSIDGGLKGDVNERSGSGYECRVHGRIRGSHREGSRECRATVGAPAILDAVMQDGAEKICSVPYC